MNRLWRPIWLLIWKKVFWYLAFHRLGFCLAQVQSSRTVDVSAMCSSNGITAQMMFDTPFNGKIYSSRYVTVHDCVYYNHYGENMILFSIPIYNCGTIVQKDSQNVISHIENEVYVQFDKDTQNYDDRRYLFVCDRSPAQVPSNVVHGTVRPGQTVIVQTLIPTRIVATHSGGPAYTVAQQPSVWMEIQEGNGPGRPAVVRRPLQLGDQITLVVSGRSTRPINEYDIFVHSCYASDGSGVNNIELTDIAGCTVRLRLADQMGRKKDLNGIISYYLPLRAFKFPTTNDVYFSCSVDVCAACNFPELCTVGRGKSIRSKRSPLQNDTNSDNFLVQDSVQILDKGDTRNFDISNGTCFTPVGMTVLLSIFSALVLSLILVTVCTVRLYQKTKGD